MVLRKLCYAYVIVTQQKDQEERDNNTKLFMIIPKKSYDENYIKFPFFLISLIEEVCYLLSSENKH